MNASFFKYKHVLVVEVREQQHRAAGGSLYHCSTIPLSPVPARLAAADRRKEIPAAEPELGAVSALWALLWL